MLNWIRHSEEWPCGPTAKRIPWHLGVNLARVERACIGRSIQYLVAVETDRDQANVLRRFVTLAGIAFPRRAIPFNGRLTRLLTTALYRATGSAVLRSLCLILLQTEPIAEPMPGRIVVREFWMRHRRAFRLAGFTWRSYARAALA